MKQREREGQRETDGLSMLVVSSSDEIGVQLERDNTELSQPLQKEFSQCTKVHTEAGCDYSLMKYICIFAEFNTLFSCFILMV